jgi:hypothetical protein
MKSLSGEDTYHIAPLGKSKYFLFLLILPSCKKLVEYKEISS